MKRDEIWIHYFTPESNRRQLSGQQQMKSVQSDERCKHQPARFRPLYFGMSKVFVHRLPREKKWTVNCEYSIALMVLLKEEIAPPPQKKERPQMKKKMCSFTKTVTVNRNDGKTTWIALSIAFALTLFSISVPSNYWLFANLKWMLNGKRFDSNKEWIHSVDE